MMHLSPASITSWTIAMVGSAGLITWTLTARKRSLPALSNLTAEFSMDEILRNIRPKLQALEPYVACGYITSDQDFFEAFGGDGGIDDCVHNADWIVKLCQRTYADGITTTSDVEEVMLRAQAIYRVAKLVPIERFVRKHYIPRLHHLCTREVADMYADLEAYVEAMLHNAPDTLDRLRAVV